ncbi:hypothetical protein ACQKFO_21595 [Rossellomorea sp. NPDC071047]|uniref:hypothetical protein n=1 Tax=Rossellomorea sp. NPDC071047 TaxID=3390675 RepID=UPI003D02856C
MDTYEQRLEIKKRQAKVQAIINHTVEGEGYINATSKEWKNIVLKKFNHIQRKEWTIEKLVDHIEAEGITFNQSKSLIVYPVRECLLYISKVAKKPLEL